MAKWSDCAICGRAIPLGELCYGIKNWKGDPEGGETICKDCLVPENSSTLTPPNEAMTLEMVAEILAEQFGDECACNVNGNDEWLPMMCHYGDVCPDPPEHLGCWMELLRNKYRRPPEGEANA